MSARLRGLFALLLFAGARAASAYDANGVAPGAGEEQVRRAFPSAHCKPLEWNSDAADRRCDDAQIVLGGIAGRITFYLKRASVQAFEVRFATADVPAMAAYLKTRYGPPAQETRETVRPKGRPAREIYRLRWQRGETRAELSSAADDRRAGLLVAQGSFEQEIYRVK